MAHYKNGIIIGPSGVGKGYGLGQVLEEYFNTKIFVTGDWCRRHRAHMADKAALIPDDEITAAAFGEFDEVRLERGGSHDFSYFIDAPRTLPQVKDIMQRFQALNSGDDVVCLHIHARPEKCIERMIERLQRHGRVDDAKWETIRTRLGIYFGEEAPDFSQDNPRYLPTGGILNEVVPWVSKNLRYFPIDANGCLEELRGEVRWKIAPQIFSV